MIQLVINHVALRFEVRNIQIFFEAIQSQFITVYNWLLIKY